MTTPSLCKSFFKPYLIYKLRTQTVSFVVSALFNVLLMPLMAADILTYHSGIGDKFAIYVPDFMYFFCALVLFVMAATGGIRTFKSCVKKDAADTLTALPLTRLEQFTADMLSGYIVNVGPFFPCALITFILSFPADKALCDDFLSKGSEVIEGLVVSWFAVMILALFLLYTLSYITSVFVTVCCGKMSSSVIFTVAVSGLTMIAGTGVGGYVLQCMTGSDSFGYYFLDYVPPFGLLGLAYDNYYYMNGIDLTANTAGYPAPSVRGVVLNIIAAAAVTYASYRIYKKRRVERTGKVFSSNAVYKVISVLGVISITSISFSSLYMFRLTWLAVLISIVITAVFVLILEAVRKFKKKGIIITGARCLGTLAVCVITLLIVDKTGAFGARYINESPDEIESINIRSYDRNRYTNIYATNNNFVEWSGIMLEFDEQKDIEKFLELHNQTLKQYYKDLRTGYSYQVEINLKNGETVSRNYSANYRSGGYENAAEVIDELNKNICLLPGYNEKESERFFQTLSVKNDVKAEIKDTFGDIEIPADRLRELCDIFTREFREKYELSDTIAGIFMYSGSDSHKNMYAFDIPSSCTETLEFINSFRGDNSERTALMIRITRNGAQIECPISVKETETELGQELMSLLSDQYESYELNRYSDPIEVFSSDLNRYYVHKKNFNRVLEIVTQFIEERYSVED